MNSRGLRLTAQPPLAPPVSCLMDPVFLSLHQSNQHGKASESSTQPTGDHKDPDQPCFTKKEVRDIIFERNELKTNLFLVQEELNYYQRWVHEKSESSGQSCQESNEEMLLGYSINSVVVDTHF